MDLGHIRGHVDVLAYCKAKKAELDQMEEHSRAAVEEAMGENEVGTVDGKIVITWRHTKSRRFNQKDHKAEQPDCHESYMQASQSRQFKVET